MGHISQPFSLVKSGIAKISGGAQQYGIPTRVIFSSQSTSALNVNEVRYVPVYVDYAVTLNAWQLEVTTGPAGAANIRLGVYLADMNLQPVGAPLYDSGAVAVASGFTGIKSASGLSVVLAPGVYLVALNSDTAMTIRTLISPTPIVAVNQGANSFIQRLIATQTFGAFPNPGTGWTSGVAGTGGLQHFASWQWTE